MHCNPIVHTAKRLWLLGMVMVLAACATPQGGGAPDDGALAASAWVAASLRSAESSGWHHQSFPGKRNTDYRPARKDGRAAIAVHAQASVSMLRQRVHIAPGELGQLRFSWWVPALIAQADLSRRDADDAAVRLVLAFDGDRQRFSRKDAALSELSEMLTGEPLPYATLMYVWSNRRDAGSVIHNPRTSRIRKLVVERGNARLGRWLDYERDVQADFIQAFGEPPGALVAIGLMTDTDNTRTQAQAWYGALKHQPRSTKSATVLAD